jgi:hypothetical protein
MDSNYQIYYSVIDDTNILQIPKNASSWVSRLVPQSTTVPTGKYNVAILRNPLDRWISGTVQFLISKHAIENNFTTQKTLEEFFQNKNFLDPHTWPQAWFVEKLSKLPTTYFWFNNDFNLLVDFLDIKNIKVHPTMKINQSQTNKRKQLLLEEYKLLSIQYKKELEEIYYMDFDLINSTNFYTGN